MRIIGKILLAGVVAVFFHVDQFWAQDDIAGKYAGTITPQELKEHLYIFASDEFEGRETGKPGLDKAAAYLADYYEALGIPGCVNGSYFQPYPLKQEKVVGSTLTAGNKEFRFIDDFYFFNSFETPEPIDFNDLCFVSYGIDDKKYSDYGKVNVTGKVVVCLSGEPVDKKGISRLTGKSDLSEWSYDPGLKIEAARKKGARALIVISRDYDQFIPRVRFWLESSQLVLDYPDKRQDKGEDGPIPFFFVSPRVGDLLVREFGAKSVEALAGKINKSGKSITRVFDGRGRIHVKREVERVNAQNVLAFIEGTDPDLKDELVVISAHYDHIGIVNGQINNGADDDGSGTVTTLELAEAFIQAKKDGNGTRRSILILNVSGEEKGLLGSEWYSEYPVFPLEKTSCNLNIDMIGRSDEEHAGDPRYVYLIGSDKLSTELHALSEQCNEKYAGLKLDYTYNDPNDPNRFYYRSDHYNFARKNVPVIFYFSGVHEDYHKPGDDPEKIQYEKMAEIGRLIFHTAWEVANRDEKLKVDVTNVFPED